MTTIEEIKAYVKQKGGYCTWDDILHQFNGLSIEENIIGDRRWYTDYEYVAKFGDKFFRMFYGVGSTEYQENEEMEYAIETLAEVEPVEVKVIKYKVKK